MAVGGVQAEAHGDHRDMGAAARTPMRASASKGSIPWYLPRPKPRSWWNPQSTRIVPPGPRTSQKK